MARIVDYVLSQADCDQIKALRRSSFEAGGSGRVGNEPRPGDVVPLVVVREWTPDYSVNGQIVLDGNDTLWVTSRCRSEAPEPGCWFVEDRS